MHRVILRKCGVWLLLILLWRPGACPAADAPAGGCRTVPVEMPAVLTGDDLAGRGLPEGIATSLKYLANQPSKKTYNLCDRQVSVAELTATLRELGQLWEETGGGRKFLRRAADTFDLLAIQENGKTKKVMVTGYFEPLVEGNLRKEPPFVYPLYAVPPDLVQEGREVGRREGGRLLPYWTREEIETRNLLAGQELVYLDNPVEAFILQVQGSGRVRLRDGSVRRVQYGAKNGRPYRSIGKFLVERGALRPREVTLPAISAYLQAHPQEIPEVLRYNESYVFFRWGDSEQCGPLGCLGEPLIPDRSVALDRDRFPPGAPAWLLGRKPTFNDQDRIVGGARMQRLVFNHDSGSAIRGAGRLDLFLGYGARARAAAGVLKGQAQLYFLLKKK